MKKLYFSNYLVIVVICSLIFMSYIRKDTTEYIPITKDVNMLTVRSDGSPGGYTGSIGDGQDCTDCHSPGVSFNLVPTINTGIPMSGYVLGETYVIDVSTTTNGNEQDYGFELTAEKADGTKVGVFDVTGAMGAPKLIGTTAVTHSNDQPPGAWSFNWTAPSVDEGDITFYAAVIAANGSNGDNNDETVTTSVTVTGSTLGIGEESILAFDIFPNPSHDYLTIQLHNEITDASIEVFDYLGRTILSKNINEFNSNLNLSNLSQGVYLIKVESEGKTGVRRFLKI